MTQSTGPPVLSPSPVLPLTRTSDTRPTTAPAAADNGGRGVRTHRPTSAGPDAYRDGGRGSGAGARQGRAGSASPGAPLGGWGCPEIIRKARAGSLACVKCVLHPASLAIPSSSAASFLLPSPLTRPCRRSSAHKSASCQRPLQPLRRGDTSLRHLRKGEVSLVSVPRTSSMHRQTMDERIHRQQHRITRGVHHLPARLCLWS